MTLKFEQFDNHFGARIHGLHEGRIIDEQLVTAVVTGLVTMPPPAGLSGAA